MTTKIVSHKLAKQTRENIARASRYELLRCPDGAYMVKIYPGPGPYGGGIVAGLGFWSAPVSFHSVESAQAFMFKRNRALSCSCIRDTLSDADRTQREHRDENSGFIEIPVS